MSADLAIVLPEIILSVYAMAALIFAVYTKKDAMAPTLVLATSALFLVMALWIGTGGSATGSAFNGMLQNDGFARFAKVVILVSAAVVLLLSQGYMKQRGLLRFE